MSEITCGCGQTPDQLVTTSISECGINKALNELCSPYVYIEGTLLSASSLQQIGLNTSNSANNVRTGDNINSLPMDVGLYIGTPSKDGNWSITVTCGKNKYNINIITNSVGKKHLEFVNIHGKVTKIYKLGDKVKEFGNRKILSWGSVLLSKSSITIVKTYYKIKKLEKRVKKHGYSTSSINSLKADFHKFKKNVSTLYLLENLTYINENLIHYYKQYKKLNRAYGFAK